MTDDLFDDAFFDVLTAFNNAVESDGDPDDVETLKDALSRAQEHLPVEHDA